MKTKMNKTKMEKLNALKKASLQINQLQKINGGARGRFGGPGSSHNDVQGDDII